MVLRELLVERIAHLRNLSDRSVVMYLSTLDRFADFLGHEPTLDDLDDLTASKFVRWRTAKPSFWGRPLSPASVAKDSAHLRTIWTWAAKKRLRRSDGELIEFPDYARPKVPKPVPKAYKADELRALIAHARHRKGYIGGVPAAWYWTTKILCLFQTGERIGAVMQLRWGQVDLERNQITFLAATRKGHRETLTLPITPALSKMLAAYKGPPEAQVWAWGANRTMTAVYSSLRVLCRTAGVPYKPFHSIRKSTASYLKRAGISAKRQLGHASEEMAEMHYYAQDIVGGENNLDYLPDISELPPDTTGQGPESPAA